MVFKESPVTTLNIWLVGASSGIGLELLKRWLQEGHNVVASSRSAQSSTKLLELQSIYFDRLVLLDLDVSISQDCSPIIEQAWSAFGNLDRWFYNAGAYDVLKQENWEVEKFEMMMQTNYMGAVRLMIPLSTYFTAQGYGEWIWNSSLSSYFGLPYGGAYSAPKAALVNLAESIQPELKAKGINLRIINHGFVKTRLTQKNSFTMPQLMEPHDAAQHIANTLENEKGFEIRFPKFLTFVLALIRFIPYSWSLRLTQKAL
jgi:short-subunit dehydrogenase